MKRSIFRTILGFFALVFLTSVFQVSAQRWGWGEYGSDPMQILDTVVSKANDGSKIQQSALDWITDQQWAYPSQYKISNTLEYIRTNIDPYFQWLVFVWLVIATILFIYAGFLMVTNVIHKEGERAKIKKLIVALVTGIILLTGFYFIVKLIVSLVTALFWWSNGSSWY